MNKAWIPLTLIFVFALIVLGVSTLVLRQDKQIRTTLSERAKEFISKKKLQKGSAWKNVDSTTNSEADKVAVLAASGERERIVQPCFTLYVPFAVEKTEIKKDCVIATSFKQPKGRIVVVYKKLTSTSLLSSADILARRINPQLYTEEEHTVNGRTFLVYTTNSFEYEKTAFTTIKDQLVAITLYSFANVQLDTQFEEILAQSVFK